MDDLLIRSGPVWETAMKTVIHSLGHQPTEELMLRCKGMNARDVSRTIHSALKPNTPPESCDRLMRDSLIATFQKQILPMPGALDLVRRHQGEIPMAVASGSPLEIIHMCMRELGIFDCFQTILSSETVPRGKPHPDVFLAAASSLGVDPAHCIVFEDSLVGVLAGKAAAMRVFSVPSSYHEEIRKHADRVFESLGHITKEDILA